VDGAKAAGGHAATGAQAAARHTVAGAKATGSVAAAAARDVGGKVKALADRAAQPPEKQVAVEVASKSPFPFALFGRNKRHVVKTGDTLHALAKQHRTTVQELKCKNNLKRETLIVGATLLL
jgi:LysM repeat protein